MKQHAVAGTGELCRITPTHPRNAPLWWASVWGLPHRVGGLLSGFGPMHRSALMAILLLAPSGLTCCTAQSQATKLDDRTFKVEGPGVPGGAEGPNRRLAERLCPGGYRVLDSERFKTSSGDFGDTADIHTNWTIRCL
jgi:hypothetical protein